MAIPVEKEPDEMIGEWGIYEQCHFCNRRTVYWHKRTNNPVCQDCAKSHKVSELPDQFKIAKRAAKEQTK